MNIKELVLVISILLSIRIAEYAMKKYKEQKQQKQLKRQLSKKIQQLSLLMKSKMCI